MSRLGELLLSELAGQMIPQDRVVMMMGASHGIRGVISGQNIPLKIKAEAGTDNLAIVHGLNNIKNRAKIVVLDLSPVRIGVRGAHELTKIMKHCPVLVHLNLGNNKIGDEGVGSLAAVLGQCASLAHLTLSDNDIGDEGVGGLAAVLKHCA